jgi:transcriptional regulator with XRE-family HTH domain
MDTFPKLIKKIRKSAGLTQAEFAKSLKVSPILVAMIETEQKNVSKNFILKLAKALDVHPSTITPFLFIVKNKKIQPVSNIEKMFIKWGEKMQIYLINKKSSNIRKYAQDKISKNISKK